MNYVATRIAELKKGQITLMQVTGISRTEYAERMFTYGTAFAEQYCKRFLNKEDMTTAMLANKNYWNWWRFTYLCDDAGIICQSLLEIRINDKGQLLPAATYHEIKAAMIGDKLLETDLSYSLKDLR